MSASRAGNKFSDASGGIGGAIWRLRSEALIVMVVTVDNELGVCFVEGLPDWPQFGIVAMRGPGAKKRYVPICKGTSRGMRGEVRTQPFLLA